MSRLLMIAIISIAIGYLIGMTTETNSDVLDLQRALDTGGLRIDQ